jgi:hypothetical protein
MFIDAVLILFQKNHVSMAALAGLKENSSNRSRSKSLSAATVATHAASPAVEAGRGMAAVEKLNKAEEEGAASAHETATADSARAEGLRRAEMMAAAFASAPHALTPGTSSRAFCLFYLSLSLTQSAVSL